MAEPPRIRSVESLIAAVRSGKRIKYVCFWGHRQKFEGQVDASCFSQWQEAPFEIDGVHYATAEHWMMAEKARLFGDEESRQAVLRAKHPGEAKRIGRGVRGFDDSVWTDRRFDLVVEGNIAKFGQNPEMGAFLLATRDRVLVEASPVDSIWGIGLAADHPDAENPEKWPGLNLLGFALMEARDLLARHGVE